MEPGLIKVGYVKRASGLKGGLIIEALTEEQERFKKGVKLLLAPAHDVYVQLTVNNVRDNGRDLLVFFYEVLTRSEAEQLVGRYLAVEESEAISLKPGEYFIHDLIGTPCYSERGIYLGKITEVFSTGSNDVFIASEEKDGLKKEILIPVIDEAIKSIEPGHMIIIKEMPGLIPKNH